MPNITNVTLGVKADLSAAERQIRQLEGKAITLNFRSSQPLGRLTGDVGEFEKSMSAANARVIAFGASAGIIGAVSTALHAMVTESIAVDKALTTINATMNLTTGQLKGFGDSLFGIAKNTGASFAEVARQAEQFSHSGLQMSEVLTRTKDAMILARISGLDAATVFKELTAEVNSFAREGLTTTQVVDRLAAVSARFGVSAKDLSEAVSGIGEAAGNAKVGFNELIALVTRVQQTTSKGGAEIGVALKTIFSRIERKSTLDSLDQLGIAVRDVRGQTLPAIDILSRLAGSYDRLGDAQKEQVAELLGGVRQVAVLKTALNDLNSSYSVYRNVLGAANNASGAAALRNEELNKSIAALANVAGNNFAKLAAAGGNDVFGPSIKKVLGAFNDASDLASGNNIGATIGGAILKGIGNALAGPGLLTGGFLAAKLLGSFASFAAKAATNVLDIGKASEQTSRVQSGINALLEQTPGLYDRILTQARSITEQEEILLGVIRERVAAQAQGQAAIANVSANLVEKQGVDFNAAKRSFVVEGGGHVPNFVSKIAQKAEIAAASQSGYAVAPHEVTSMPARIDGKNTTVVYNTREKVIPNFAGTGEPAIIPPNETLASMLQKKFSRNFVPNFALNAIEFGNENAAIGLNKSRSTTFSLEDFLLKTARGADIEHPDGFLGIAGLTSKELSKVRFKSIFRTASVDARLDEHAASLKAGNGPVLSRSSVRRLNEVKSKVEGYRKIYAAEHGEAATAQKEGDFFEDAFVSTYGGKSGSGARRFRANNSRQDFRRGINITNRAIAAVERDYGLPKGTINIDLKRTIARQTVGASLTGKAVYGSGFGEQQLQQIIGSVDQLTFPKRTVAEGERIKQELKSFIRARKEQAQQSDLENLSRAGDLDDFAKKNPHINRDNFFDFFGKGYVPNMAIEPEALLRTKKVYESIKNLRGTLPLHMIQDILNVPAQGGLRFGVPASAFQPQGIGASGAEQSLALRYAQPTQVGALFAPQTYESLGGGAGGIHYIDNSPHINLLDSKAFQRNPFFANPLERNSNGGVTPFRSQEELQEYLADNLKKQGFNGLARRVQQIRNPNYRPAKEIPKGQPKQPHLLKEGLDLHVALRDLPILNVENTNLGSAYREEVKSRGLVVGKHAPSDFGDAVNTVVERAAEGELGYKRSKNERIDVPSHLVEKILGVDRSVTPLGIDAKSSLENFVVRELIKKGNSSRAGLDVFQQHLAQSIAGSGISQPEQEALVKLLHGSSNAFLKARGFVPNLVARQISGLDAVSGGLTHSIGGLREAIGRETTATGISLSQVRVNFAKNAGEPAVSVTNTRDEGAHADPAIGFDRIRKAGGNIFLAGSGQEYGRGFIPNFALTDPDRDYVERRVKKRDAEGGFANEQEKENYRKQLLTRLDKQSSKEKVHEQTNFKNANTPNATAAEKQDNLTETHRQHFEALDKDVSLREAQYKINLAKGPTAPAEAPHAISVDDRIAHVDKVLSAAESENGFTRFFKGKGGRGAGNVENRLVESLGDNYAQGFSKEQASTIRERVNNVNGKRASTRGNVTQGLFAASFLLPTLGGAVAQGFEEGGTKRNVEGISSAIGQGVSIAALGGGNPAAIIAGAGVALYQITRTINDNVKPSFEDLAKKAQELGAKNQEQIQAASGVIQAQSGIEEAVKSGNASQIKAATLAYSNANAAVSDPELRKNLRNAGTTEEKARVLNDFSQNAQKDVSALNAQALSTQFSQKFSSGFGDGHFGNLSQKYLGTTRSQKVTDESIAELEKLAQTFVASGEKGGGKVESQIKENLDPQFAALFDRIVFGLRRTQQITEEVTEATKNYQVEVAGLNTTIAKLRATANFKTSINTIGENARYEVNTNKIKTLSNLYSPYLSDSAKATIENQGALRENEHTRNEGLQGVQDSIGDLFESVRNNTTGLNPADVKGLQTSVLNKGGAAGLDDVQRLIDLASADKSKTDVTQLDALYKIQAQLVSVNTKFETGNTIARDNLAAAKAQVVRNKNASFLGGSSLGELDTKPFESGAEATKNVIDRHFRENPLENARFRLRDGTVTGPQASNFQFALNNARNNSSDYGAEGKLRRTHNDDEDADNIAGAEEVGEFYKEGLGETSGPAYQIASEKYRKGVASRKYQSLEKTARVYQDQFVAGAKFDKKTEGLITNATNSRDPAQVQEAIDKVTAYNQNTKGNGGRGDQEFAYGKQVVTSLQNLKFGLGRVDPASREITARALQTDSVPKEILDLNTQVKNDNERISHQFDDLIARAEAIAANTLDIDASIKQLAELTAAQQKVADLSGEQKKNADSIGELAKQNDNDNEEILTSEKAKLRLTNPENVTALDANLSGAAFLHGEGNGVDLKANTQSLIGDLRGGQSRDHAVGTYIAGLRQKQSEGSLTGVNLDDPELSKRLLLSLSDSPLTGGIRDNDQQNTLGSAITGRNTTIKGLREDGGLITSKLNYAQGDVNSLGTKLKDSEGTLQRKQQAIADNAAKRNRAAADVTAAQRAFDATITADPETREKAQKALDAARARQKTVTNAVTSDSYGGVPVQPVFTPPLPASAQVVKKATVIAVTAPVEGRVGGPNVDYNDPVQAALSGVGTNRRFEFDKGEISGINSRYQKPTTASQTAISGVGGLESRFATDIRSGKIEDAREDLPDLVKSVKAAIPEVEKSGTPQEKQDFARLTQILESLNQTLTDKVGSNDQTGNNPNSSRGSGQTVTNTINVDGVTVAAGSGIDVDKLRSDLQSWLKEYVDSGGTPMPKAPQTTTAPDATTTP